MCNRIGYTTNIAANTRFALAVHCAGLIAFGDRKTVTSLSIAHSAGTNPVVVRRIVGQLVKAGIVDMRKGQGGGAMLARPAGKISLGEIYRAVERCPLLAVPEFGEKTPCSIAQLAAPVLRFFFGEAERAMVARLDKTRLSEVLDEVLKRTKAECR